MLCASSATSAVRYGAYGAHVPRDRSTAEVTGLPRRWEGRTAAPPCGLIMAGASLAHVGLKEHWQPAAIATVFKLAGLPLMVWAAGRYLFTIDPLWLTVATLNAAMPAGANVFLVAQLYRRGVGLATNAVVISTGMSVLTLSAALLLLGVQTR